MTHLPLQVIDLVDDFVHIGPTGGAFAFRPTGSFWGGTDPTDGGRSIGAVSFDTPDDLHHRYDERHPGTDEVIIVGDGQVDVWLDAPGGEHPTRLARGQATIVPAGIWHRLTAVEPGWLVFCNRRRGIETRPHRPSEPA